MYLAGEQKSWWSDHPEGVIGPVFRNCCVNLHNFSAMVVFETVLEYGPIEFVVLSKIRPPYTN